MKNQASHTPQILLKECKAKIMKRKMYNSMYILSLSPPYPLLPSLSSSLPLSLSRNNFNIRINIEINIFANDVIVNHHFVMVSYDISY